MIMPRLEIRSGKASGKSVELKGSTVTLGNRRNATVELKDNWVSFNHAQITCDGGRYFLNDAHSRAGTFLNDRRVDRTPVAINEGDRILLGKTEILFLGDEKKAQGPAITMTTAPSPAQPEAPAQSDRIASLERDLWQATGDLVRLREHVVGREKELAQVYGQLRSAGDPLEAARWKKAAEDLREKARAKLEEVRVYAKSLEARLLDAGGTDATTLIEKDHEIARLKEELGRVEEETKQRIFVAAEKLQLEIASKGDVEEERARADGLERESGILRSRAQDLESEKKRLEDELKKIRSEIAGYEQALEERNKDVERLEALVQRSGAPGGSEGLDRLRAELDAEKKRADEHRKTILDLRTQVEEINEDMLEQEDELRAEIASLEKKLAEAPERPGGGTPPTQLQADETS